MKNLIVIIFTVFGFIAKGNAQTATNIAPLQWNAKWIAAPNDNGTEYGVYYFRKKIDLPEKPSSFVVHVSADNRYKLFVNGVLVSLGPARGDIYYWNFETVDLSPFLTRGSNVISALVWNESQYRPEAQITIRTAFILQGNSKNEELVNTNDSWKSIRNNAYKPLWGYFAASTGDFVDMNKTVKGWMSKDLEESGWLNAAQIDNGHIKGQSDGFGWMLVPSSLPQMELSYQRIAALRKAEGIKLPESFPSGKTAFTVPANTTITLLLDQTYETNAYVNLLFSRGKDAGISLSYAESLYDHVGNGGTRKGNRNDVDGKEFSGRKDSIVSNGDPSQSFTSLYWRTFRYIRMIVQTKDEPLIIEDLYGMFTGYPFKQNALFTSDKKEISQILNIGWRTARLNAMETYFDCPYYEQLQYIGDTRIQTLISYYNSGDDRLARNAINLMDHSRLTEGVTLSRYPTHSTQVISTFSLWYIGMLHDYWMYRADTNFVKDKLTGARSILNFFSKYQGADGSLANTPYWTFVDWAGGKNWFVGSPPKGNDGSSAILDLQLLIAYQWAAEMESRMGLHDFSLMYRKKASQLAQTIRNKYWNTSKKLFADTKEKDLYSQHANSLAILAGLVKPNELQDVCKNLLHDSSLTQCSIYFKYYLHQALIKAGLGNDYQNWLDIWRDNIKMGLTTWAEESNLQTTRSDCHAWGASPNIEYFRTVLGIDSDAPGFTKIRIEPHLGDLKNVVGEMPHPNGKIAVEYSFLKNRWKIKINLPRKTSGTFVWKNKSYKLKEGGNLFNL